MTTSSDNNRTYRSCSWCHELVLQDPSGSPVFCATCGHRGDVSRMRCNCPRCVPAGVQMEERDHGDGLMSLVFRRAE